MNANKQLTTDCSIILIINFSGIRISLVLFVEPHCFTRFIGILCSRKILFHNQMKLIVKHVN